MGIHLFVYRITGTEVIEDYGTTDTYFETERQDWFDSLRYSGDREFVLENEFSSVGDAEYVRPTDFNKCRDWVLNSPYGNKERLLDALTALENDSDLVFTWSY